MSAVESTLTGTTGQEPGEYEKRHREIAREAAAEGFVLLRNREGILPLSLKKPIALYGAGAEKTIKGGTGSGDVNSRPTVSIREGLATKKNMKTPESPGETGFLKKRRRMGAATMPWQ